MIILPAIDLKDGRCVRLYKGDFSTAHRVADDPVRTADSFAQAGAEMLHMVDLDGAREGRGRNRSVVKEVVDALGGRIPVELGGGIRTLQDIEDALGLGVSRVVLGTAAAENPELVREAVSRYGRRVAAGIDAKNGRVRTAGWTEDAGMDAVELAKKMESYGVKTIIFTDIDTDGMQEGPAFGRLSGLRKAVGCELVASGGISGIGDIRRLKQAGIDAAIIGKALYTGAVDLKEAIREAGGPCLQNG